MVSSLGCANRMQREVIDNLKAAQEIVTQFTDSLLEVHKPVNEMVSRLLSAEPTLRVMISGAGWCGKSELINAILGDNLLECGHAESTHPTTHMPLLVRPGISGIPLLNTASGRPLAVEAPSIREWIRGENKRQQVAKLAHEEASKEEARLHHQHSIAGLPRPTPTVRAPADKQVYLECAPFFLRDSQPELEVTLLDTCRDTPFASSEGRRHLAYDADVFVLMVDYRKLRTPAESEIFGPVPISAFLPLHHERFIFVVSNAESLFLRDMAVSRNSALPDEGSEKFASQQEVVSYVLELLKPQFGKVCREQVVLIYSKLAVFARIVHHNSGNVSLDTLYDFCDLGYGSEFMQGIDAIPLPELQHQAAGHAQLLLQQSGLLATEQAFRTMSYNGCSLFLLSVATEALVLFTTFSATLEEAHPGLQIQETVTEAELVQLLREQDFINSRIEQVCTITTMMRTELEALLEDSIGRFWETCFEHLKSILRGADLDSFKLRQQTGAGDVIQKVAVFLEFVNGRYIRDRRFIESRRPKQVSDPDEDTDYKFCDEDSIEGQVAQKMSSSLIDDLPLEKPPEYHSAASSIGAPGESRGGTPPVQSTLAEDGLMTAVDHLVEENAAFIDTNRDHLLQAIETELAEKVLSVGQAFTHFLKDELELVLPALVGLCLVRKEELSEMLRSRAVDLLYATENRLGKGLDLDHLLEEWRAFDIVTPDERVLNNFVRELPYEATKIFRDVLLPAVNIGPEVSEADLSCKIGEEVLTAWREVILNKDTYEVTTYDRQGVSECLNRLRDQITEYVSAYSDDVGACIALQQQELHSITTHRNELDIQQDQIKVPIAGLRNAINMIREAVHWDYDNAVAAKEELLMHSADNAE